MARHEVKGLDTLRFVAAATVALGHGARFPVAAWLGRSSEWTRALVGLNGVSFDGLAAVLVFFVISGFCIHYAPATGAPFNPAAFWVRRGVRILGPMLAALEVAHMLGPSAQGALGAVIWSVYCELIYYALYPPLRIAFRRFGLPRVIAASLIVSAVLIAVGWRTSYYWGFSVFLAWLVAAPTWLLGCLMAEQIAAGKAAPRLRSIWTWRAGVWLYAAFALAAFFHTPWGVGMPVLLFPFQGLAYLWVWAEVQHFERRGVPPLLEWCGRWSYSLYLIHNMVLAEIHVSPGVFFWTWTLRVTLILAASLVFYALIEAPSHWVARAASRKVGAAFNSGQAAATAP